MRNGRPRLQRIDELKKTCLDAGGESQTDRSPIIRRSRVLIVDDDHDISHGVAVRLRAAGYDTSSAQDGAEGLKQAQQRPPEAIVLDMRMPVMDGMATLLELKKSPQTRKIPVVILSASVVDEAPALDAGARFFIRKPFDGRSLVEAVDAVTQRIEQKERTP